jgi:DNA-binding transcriptional MerR regulator
MYSVSAGTMRSSQERLICSRAAAGCSSCEGVRAFMAGPRVKGRRPFEPSRRRDPDIVRQRGARDAQAHLNGYDRGMYIGELARRAGCSPKAVRLYEARGLLGTVERAGSYRVYGEQDLVLVQRIRQALGLGFRLDELHGLHRIDDAAGWQALARLLRERRAKVQSELRRLEAQQAQLAALEHELLECSLDMADARDACESLPA